MNMSEFDGQMNEEDAWPSSISLSGHTVPDDFSDEDMAFAQELGSLFDVEQENLPPYFVQTLLDSENPRFSPVDRGFEHKARVRVFRRLKLRRRLFEKKRPSLQMVVAALPVRRPLIACGMAMVLLMLMTIIMTAPSFAAGHANLAEWWQDGCLVGARLPTRSPSHQWHGIGRNGRLRSQ